MRPLALRAVKALERLYGTEYQVGSGADLLYEASGSSHDYAKGVLNIPFSFLVELRPQNTLHSTGFLLPEAEIMDTADETWEAIKIVADKMLERYAPLPPIETSRGRNLMGITSSTEIDGNEHCSTSTTPTATPTPTTSIKASSNTSTPKTTIKTTRRNTSPPPPPTTTSTTTISIPSSSLNSSSIRNTISNKLENLIPWASIESRNKIRSKNNRGGIRKTIVNVKICTGGRGGKSSGSSKRNSWETLLTFPPKGKSSEEEEEEDVEDELPEKTRKSREQNSEEEGEEDEIEGNEKRENKELPSPPSPRLIKCYDNSVYCKWWRMHGLCTDLRVKRLCTLSCTIECQI
uniref:Peptidase M14 carboxypeptidase A domain-containing protein n=1 Tax=Meloidogyne floridensis TaxID=298350 RepID=A0A915NS74_9BILA